MISDIKPLILHNKPPHSRSRIGVDTLTVTPIDSYGNYLLSSFFSLILSDLLSSFYSLILSDLSFFLFSFSLFIYLFICLFIYLFIYSFIYLFPFFASFAIAQSAVLAIFEARIEKKTSKKRE